MSDYANSLLDSMSTIVNQSVSEAAFDTTIQATILNCEDASKGKYKVKYQDSIFYAYADNDLKQPYSKDAKVYILVPSNDFSKTKRIIGTVNNLATDYVSVVAGSEESYDKVGTDIIDDNGEYGIISGLSWDRERNFITLYDAGKSDNIISVNENVAKEYMSKCEYFIMAANFRTALIESQKFNGTYSYKITIQFKDKASGEDKYRDYILSSLEMTGQPYNFLSKTRQFKVCRYEGLEYVKISKVMFLCSNFPKTNEVEDLFISDLEFYAAKPIPQEELTTYHVTLKTPQGWVFEAGKATSKLPIEATLKINSKNVDPGTCDFFWFLQDNSINTNSERYHTRGGIGWRCLNELKYVGEGDNQDKQWTSKGIYRYEVEKEDVPVEYSTFKCVVVDSTGKGTEALQEIINRDFIYQVKIWSDQINDKGTISWYDDIGNTDLKCITTRGGVETTTNLSYIWGKQDAYGNAVPINPNVDEEDYAYWVDYVSKADEYVAHNPGVFFREQYPYYDEYKEKIAAYDDQTRVDGQWLRNVRAIDIDTMATYIVTVIYTNQETKKETVIGTAKLVITNGKSTGGYILNLEKPPLYKYNSNGVSPASDSMGTEKIIIEPLSFILLDSQGTSLTPTVIASNFNIKWTIPALKTMIIVTDPSAELNEDESEYYVKNKVTLDYTIADVFSLEKNNNTIKLELTSKDDDSIYLSAIVTLLFTKEGSIGTNGSEYNITINLVKQNTEQKYTDKFDIPIVEITNYNISPKLTPLNFYANSGEWLEFSFWKNGEEIFKGVNSNTKPGFEGLTTTEGFKISNLQWQMLGTNSYYYVSSAGKFSASGTIPLDPCNIVKLTFSYQDIYYSCCIPIATVLIDNENYHSAPQNGGFTEVMYKADGTSPSFDKTNPFKTKTYLENEDKTENLEYKWEIAGTEPQIKFIKKECKNNEQWAEPKDVFINAAIDTAVVCSIGEEQWYPDPDWQNDHPMEDLTPDEEPYWGEFQGKVQVIQEDETLTEEEKETLIQAEVQIYKNVLPFYLNIFTTIHLPIHTLVNRYSFSGINDWDGDIYTLNDDKDVLLVPQIGAGRKENDNSFSGMVMGVVDVKKKKISDVGLFGYNNGERTFFLDGKTGKVELGISYSKIIIDPTPSGLLPKAQISANYSKTEKTGMLIDLIEPSITYGNDMFSVDENGHLIAQSAEISGIINAHELNANGCSIGNFEISKDALLMAPTEDARMKYYDVESEYWNFDIITSQEEDGHGEDEGAIIHEPELKYKRIRTSADIYFGKYGLNIGKVNEEDDKPYFQVTEKGKLSCKEAYIENALEISTHKFTGDNIIIGEGGTLKFENEAFEINEEGKMHIDEIFCNVIHANLVNPEGEYDKSLIGPKISLLNGANSYFTITYNEGIKSLVNFTGKEIQCEKLDIGNNCTLFSDGLINAKRIAVDSLEANELDINDYVFTSSAEVDIKGKILENVSISRGKILGFAGNNITPDIETMPKIIGWVPIDEEGTIFAEKPHLELASGYKIMLNSMQYIDLQTGGEDGGVLFLHNGMNEEGQEITEEYAKINIEGLKLHEGGDTLVSMLDGTYKIPYPPAGQYYDKIFSMDGYLFDAIYVSDPTEQQSIDLTSAFGTIAPQNISVQLCITLNLKGIVATVSEVIETIPDSDNDKDKNTEKTIRNFYINYNRIPTQEEFGEEAITMHWTAFFFKKN